MSDETWPDDLDPAHSGVARLAQAALGTPRPSAAAETESRRRVVALMEKSVLSPRVLREMPSLPSGDSWLSRWLRFWKR